ncbi:MAG: D-aminoacyl-tRNA deacylase [Rikenellaceae bacterium]
MKIVIQRVSEAQLHIGGELYSSISGGVVVLLGITHDDTSADADYLVSKMLSLRIFDDPQGVMNLSLMDTQGEVMVVSQFTLYGSAAKGNRPSYIAAARGDVAKPLYEYFTEQTAQRIKTKVATGSFGADMQVSLVNDGPVTIIIESKK